MTTSDALNAAFAHHQAGDLDAAEAGYKAILRSEPSDLNGLQLLGVLTHQRGRSAEAVAVLGEALGILERSSDAAAGHATLHNNLGNALRAIGRLAEAAAHYRRGIALEPGLAEIHFNLGNALLVQGDVAGAVAGYEAALRLGLPPPECLDQLADAYAAAGWLRDAGDASAATAGTGAAAAAASSDTTARRIERWLGVARTLNARSQRAAAAAACRCALERAPGHAGARLTLAAILADMGSAADAAAECRALAAVAPANSGAHYILGRALADLGDNGGAIEALRRCLAIDPRHAAALYNLGALLAKVGLADLAIPLFEMAIAVRPGDANSHAALGNIAQAKGDGARAHACFRRACELRPLATWPAAAQPAEFAVLLLQAPGIANTPPDFLFGNADYDRHLFALLPDLAPDIGRLARSGDIIVNLISDADQGPKVLAAAADLVDRLGKPAINHPRRVLATARDAMTRLTAGIPRCRVPATARWTRAALQAADAAAGLEREGFSMPLLVRVAGTHGGDAFERIDRADEIAGFLADHDAEGFYVISFVDYRSADGYFRKYRFVFTDSDILPYHLAIGKHWKVHHYTTDMARNAWMQEEEKAFLDDPQSVFSSADYETLAAIRAAVGLDFFGIDCGLDRDGNIVVFEVNASILIHDDNAAFPYKTPACLRIKHAFASMLRRTAMNALAER